VSQIAKGRARGNPAPRIKDCHPPELPLAPARMSGWRPSLEGMSNARCLEPKLADPMEGGIRDQNVLSTSIGA
jgi:hypothetical protein